jgi:hypothetical protein
MDDRADLEDLLDLADDDPGGFLPRSCPVPPHLPWDELIADPRLRRRELLRRDRGSRADTYSGSENHLFVVL